MVNESLGTRSSGPRTAIVSVAKADANARRSASVGVKPGDLVDVIATFGGGGAHTEVAGEAIEVLAVDRAGGGASFGASPAGSSGGVGLVLLVTPTDAERLAFASAFATLTIAVRSPDDLVPGSSFTIPVTAAR